jgi:hypothetical protein
MKGVLNHILLTWRILSLTLFLLFIALPCTAEIMNSETPGDKESAGPKLSMYSEVTLEYTDNIYRLTEDQISRMEANDQDDIDSGRFKDMDSISDYILEPRIGIRWRSNSPLGGQLRLISWLGYHYYTRNDEAGFLEGKIRLKNSVRENGDLMLEGNFLRGYKKKNYLSGTNDINENGNISGDERTYSSATYDEYELIAAYKHEFIKNRDKEISELDIHPFVGYSSRTYNSIFDNRDKDIAFGGLGINIEFLDRIDLEIVYRYENVSSPDNRELILFDEINSLTDVNDDGVMRRNAPLMTHIDRSADRHTIEINPSFKLMKDVLLFMGYSKRTSKYNSDNPLDIEHYHQKAYRERIRSGIKYRFSKPWSAEAEYRRTKNEDEEDGEYSQDHFLFTVRYRY